jgi:aspartate ammonia-lyase
MENFIARTALVSPHLIAALALVKKACCMSNCQLGYIDIATAAAMQSACDDVIAGTLHTQFPLDALQGGAGTSTNMNVNEVIANRTLELLKHSKGDYTIVHPIEHVNMHQSTNDVYPTALKIAVIQDLRKLSAQITELQNALQNKEQEFSGILTIGRTELQDAVPITLGAQFASFAEAYARDRWRTFKCEERLRIVNIGGTAVGTGLGVPRRYIFLVIEKLRELSGLGLTRAENSMDQTANADAFVETAGMLNAYAVNLIKIANDLRQLHFAGEISLPPVQAGSSFMPGKINPVICEAVIAAGVRMKALNTIVTDAAAMGTFQLCEFLPLLADALLESLECGKAAAAMLTKHIPGITANPNVCMEHACRSTTIVTAFLPHIGYERAQKLIQEYNPKIEPFRTYLERTLGSSLVATVLSPQNIMTMGFNDNKRTPRV